MRVQLATEPGDPKVPNEDWAFAASDLAVVLDGATARIETGCIHGVAWYVRHLGAALVAGGAKVAVPLETALAHSIRAVAAQHSDCDLTHPGTPSAGVAVLRLTPDWVEYLVLADTAVVLDTGAGVQVVTDDRIAAVAGAQRAAARRLPVGSPERDEALRVSKRAEQRARNQPGGFWVAAADPAAAEQAIRGQVPRVDLARVAVLTDGAVRAVDPFGLFSWLDLLDVLDKEGPAELIARVRAAEASDPEGRRWPRNKPSDDATVVYGEIGQSVR